MVVVESFLEVSIQIERKYSSLTYLNGDSDSQTGVFDVFVAVLILLVRINLSDNKNMFLQILEETPGLAGVQVEVQGAGELKQCQKHSDHFGEDRHHFGGGEEYVVKF